MATVNDYKNLPVELIKLIDIARVPRSHTLCGNAYLYQNLLISIKLSMPS